MRPLKIAFITSMKDGLTQFIFRDIDALDRKGHQVRILTLLQRKGLYNPLPHWEVNSINWALLLFRNLLYVVQHPLTYIGLVRTAVQTGTLADLSIAIHFLARVRGADVIYAYFGDHKLYVGYYCKRITGVPLVVSIRAYELYRNPRPAFFSQALECCDCVITITDHNRNLLVDNHGVCPEKIEIVRQIVDLDQFKFEPKIKVLIVAFFAEKKGHEVLFRAIQHLGRDDLEVWVVGDVTSSVLRVDCHALVKELGIESQVAFFGAQRDNALRALYRECDVFCLPSRPDRFGDHEGFPNVIAEAMAFGKPVVSTRHAGIPEAIDSILVDENNVEQLAEALRRACNSAELRRQLGTRNREVAEQMFAPRNNDALADILARTARQRHSWESDNGHSERPQEAVTSGRG